MFHESEVKNREELIHPFWDSHLQYIFHLQYAKS